MKTALIMEAIEVLDKAGAALRGDVPVDQQVRLGVRCLQAHIRLKHAMEAEHPEVKIEETS